MSTHCPGLRSQSMLPGLRKHALRLIQLPGRVLSLSAYALCKTCVEISGVFPPGVMDAAVAVP
eukprot:1612332-Rhodomonas_salina.5